MKQLLGFIIILLVCVIALMYVHNARYYALDDLNRDGQVNTLDLSKFLSNYHPTLVPVQP